MAKDRSRLHSCEKPNGGKKAQAGCFCPEGEMLEDGKCVSLENCQCEYAGQLYGAGRSSKKGAECKTCKCVGGGVEECEDKKLAMLSVVMMRLKFQRRRLLSHLSSQLGRGSSTQTQLDPWRTPLELTVVFNGVDVKKDIRLV